MCDICKLGADDALELGNFVVRYGVRVHYFCLLLSTNLPQNGNERLGILGFLIPDILTEIISAEHRVCCYCCNKYASIKCAECSVYFHLVCGLRNDCRFEFLDEFNSFCHEHHGILHEKKHTASTECYRCLSKMGQYNAITSITGSCCSSNSWIHRKCLKKYALAAGTDFKCLSCGDTKFRDEARRLGIFVPDRPPQVDKGNSTAVSRIETNQFVSEGPISPSKNVKKPISTYQTQSSYVNRVADCPNPH